MIRALLEGSRKGHNILDSGPDAQDRFNINTVVGRVLNGLSPLDSE